MCIYGRAVSAYQLCYRVHHSRFTVVLWDAAMLPALTASMATIAENELTWYPLRSVDTGATVPLAMHWVGPGQEALGS